MQFSKKAVFTLFTLFFLLNHITYSQPAKHAGEVEKVVGSVVIKNSNAEAFKGMEVYVGDSFETGDDSVLEIKFIDDTFISVGSNTNFEINEFVFNPSERKSVTTVLKGKMRTKIKSLKDRDSSVEYRTKNAVAGVKGTIFYIDADNNLFSVREGVVEVRGLLSGTAAVTLRAGQFTRIVNGIPSLPGNMTDKMWYELEKQLNLPPEANIIKRNLPIKIKKPKIFR